MSDFKKESGGYIASEKCWLTKDGKIVRDGDVRAAQLLAPKGGVISLKQGERLKLDDAKLEPLQKPTVKEVNFGPAKTEAKKEESVKTVAPEDISTRQTRPQEISHKR